ncbi:MAG: DUF2029 domain-containing protein [Oscillospiraceae bacterium]|nr:DUF2029 domain-containing protein [Oscillospiraceae bacterium]
MDAVLFILIIEALLAFVLLYRAGALDSRGRLLAGVLLISAAFVLRWFALPHETADYRDFLSRWVQWFRDNGGFRALKGSIGNYNIPYLYFLAAFSYIPVRDLYLIKLLSILFDVFLAYSVSRIVSFFRDSPSLRLLSFLLVLFWPTVLLNGAYWGQCDSIYVALALLGYSCALREKPVLSMVFIALSFSFKLQAVFFMPLYAVFLFHGRIRWKHLPVFPLTYVLTVFPAVLAGRPFSETILLYSDQLDSIGTGLNYNSPSVFSFLDFRSFSADPELLTRLGILAAFLFMGAVLLLCLIRRRSLDAKILILAGAVLVLGIPFLLPRMHERYFFGADMLTLAVCFLFPEAIPAALLTEFASFLGYYAYLKGQYLLLMRSGAVCLLLALALLLFLFSRRLFAAADGKDPEGEK